MATATQSQKTCSTRNCHNGWVWYMGSEYPCSECEHRQELNLPTHWSDDITWRKHPEHPNVRVGRVTREALTGGAWFESYFRDKLAFRVKSHRTGEALTFEYTNWTDEDGARVYSANFNGLKLWLEVVM